MNRTGRTLKNNLRIIFAIASKDIQEAIKNRITLSIMLGVTMLMVTSLAIPLLARINRKPTALVYDPTRSTFFRALTTSDDFRVGVMDNQEELEERLLSSTTPALGLVVPADFQPGQQGSTAVGVVLEGYYAHWSDPAQIAQTAAFFEEQLSKLAWQKVGINLDEHVLYPSEVMGWPFLVAMTLSIILMTVGIALTPLLLIEEKETHTFEALLVSPASFSHVVVGKGLVGIFYCMLGVVVAVLFNLNLILSWPLLLLGIFLGAAFSVSVGLLMGALIENPATLNLWMVVVMLVMLLPTTLGSISGSRLPEWLKTILYWFPSWIMNRTFSYSMAVNMPWMDVARDMLVLLGIVLLLLGLVIWRIRHSEYSSR
jgi:ABC-2 type transport system permease protein